MKMIRGGFCLLRMGSGMAVGVKGKEPLLCEFFCVVRDGWGSCIRADLLYRISNVTNDRVTLTTSLAARAVDWTDVAGSYEMDFGHKVATPQANPLKRGLLDGSYNKNSNSNVNISAGTPGLRKSIYTDHE